MILIEKSAKAYRNMTEFNVFISKNTLIIGNVYVYVYEKRVFFEKQDKEKSQVFSIKNRIHFTVISREQLSNAQFFRKKPYTYTTCVVYTKLYTVFNILIGVKKWLKKLLHIVLITRMKRSL